MASFALSFGKGFMDAASSDMQDRKYMERMSRYNNTLKNREMSDWKEKEGYKSEAAINVLTESRAYEESERIKKEKREIEARMAAGMSEEQARATLGMSYTEALNTMKDYVVVDGRLMFRGLQEAKQNIERVVKSLKVTGDLDSPYGRAVLNHVKSGGKREDFDQKNYKYVDRDGKLNYKPMEQYKTEQTLEAARLKVSGDDKDLNSSMYKYMDTTVASTLGGLLQRASGGKFRTLTETDPATGDKSVRIIGIDGNDIGTRYVLDITDLAVRLYRAKIAPTPHAASQMAVRELGDFDAYKARATGSPAPKTGKDNVDKPSKETLSSWDEGQIRGWLIAAKKAGISKKSMEAVEAAWRELQVDGGTSEDNLQTSIPQAPSMSTAGGRPARTTKPGTAVDWSKAGATVMNWFKPKQVKPNLDDPRIR